MVESSRVNIAILLFEGVEELDFIGVYSPLVKASHINHAGKEIHVMTIGEGKCQGSNGLTLVPELTIEEFLTLEKLDAFIVPGGRGAKEAAKRQPIVDSINFSLRSKATVYTICTGSILLGEIGVVGGLKVACHQQKKSEYKNYNCLVEGNVVQDGWLVSAGGFDPGLGLKATEIAFHVLNDFSPDIIDSISKRIEVWPQTFESRRMSSNPKTGENDYSARDNRSVS